MGMQAPHSPVKLHIAELHQLLLVVITLITLFVAGLLLYALWRFRASRNPIPSRFSHNTVIEVAWTIVPVLILVVIAIPSFRLIYYEDRVRDPDMTINVTGHQWYWEYTYPGAKPVDIASNIIDDADLKPGQMRLLSVDNPLVLPAGKKVRILTTSGDVIHSFFIPSLGVQRYAIPGRTIETWVEIDQPGDYYGECNQICGINHSRMPIMVHAVTQADFATWMQAQQRAAASASAAGALSVAQAQP
jgi:cytochrome c oxidase subunit 2